MKNFLIILLFSLNSYSQNIFDNKVVNPLQKNPIAQEKIFLHTNKSIYFSEDIVWFKVYIGNEDQTPSLNTTVAHVILRDIKGNLLKSKKLFIQNGVGNGEFDLNAPLSSGTYYIQAYTQNILNFKNDFVFTSKIEVLGKQKTKVSAQKNKYDIQIFPEGGYLVENTLNTIGIKSLLNGKGVDFSGRLVTADNEEITTISSEHLGMGKSQFFYEAGERYRVQIKVNDTLLSLKVPIAREEGISLGVDNRSLKNLKITLKTNEQTLKDPQTATYALLYHQRNRILGYFDFSKLDSLKAAIIINKNIFNEGVNTVSLFKNNKPIAERKFYIEKQANHVTSKITRVGATEDSIIYKIELRNRNKPILANLSTSILLPNPKNYKEKQNIITAFLLTPFVKGNIENPAYYFNKENDDREAAMDLLLLTQGWTEHSLEEMINEVNPRPIYNSENGINLEGKINGILNTNNLGLITNQNRLIDQIFLNGNKEFQFRNLLVYNGDTIKYSFLDKFQNAIKPSAIVMDTAINYLPEFHSSIISTNSFVNNFETRKNVPWLTEGTNLLEEVNLVDKKRSEKFTRLKYLHKKYKPLVWDIGKYYEIQLPDKYHGYNNKLMNFLRIDQNVELVNTENNEYYLKIPINKEATLYIDGERIKSFELNTLNVGMENIKTIMVQPVGRGNRIYQVFTDDNYKNNVKELFVKYVITEGYDKAKPYYQPLYSFDRSSYQSWKEIDWKANIQTNEKGDVFIKVAKMKNNSIFFSIQGLSNQGLLISETAIN